MELVRGLNRRGTDGGPRAHDLNQACRYAGLIVMSDGHRLGGRPARS